MTDDFAAQYSEHIEGTYDCIDRIVLNAYFILAQGGGGFRTWWRILHGTDENLNNTQLMRYAGRFSRRIRAWTKKHRIPLKLCHAGERKYEIAETFMPEKPGFSGIFCILFGRAPAPVIDVQRFGNNGINIVKKKPMPYVYHYYFHIMDREWGHVVIKFCPHPPFNAQIILNGHEYVARCADKRKIQYTKDGNCFTRVSNATDLARVADTMTAVSGVGRLAQVCERWLYSRCLCFALDIAEQKKTRFTYDYSVYQVEYSRNFMFHRGRVMEQTLHGIIDRTRAPLDVRQIKTIFGAQRRPYRKDKFGKKPRIEVKLEKPVYNLTVFKIHFGRLTVKMYSKGERVLRLEAIAHNTADLKCGKRIARFPIIIETLEQMLIRFIAALQEVNLSLFSSDIVENWPRSTKLGASRIGGININSPRLLAVLRALTALALSPHGFTSNQVAAKVREIGGPAAVKYDSRKASYDVKKLRAKGLIHKIENTRRYEAAELGLRKMTGVIVFHDKMLTPFLAAATKKRIRRSCQISGGIDHHYANIHDELQKVYEIIGIAA